MASTMSRLMVMPTCLSAATCVSPGLSSGNTSGTTGEEPALQLLAGQGKQGWPLRRERANPNHTRGPSVWGTPKKKREEESRHPIVRAHPSQKARRMGHPQVHRMGGVTKKKFRSGPPPSYRRAGRRRSLHGSGYSTVTDFARLRG